MAFGYVPQQSKELAITLIHIRITCEFILNVELGADRQLMCTGLSQFESEGHI